MSLSLPSGGGGDDAWEGVAMPEFHRRVLRVLTEWMKRYGADVMDSSLAAEEIKHFMLDLQAVGFGYEVWVEHVNSLLVAQVREYLATKVNKYMIISLFLLGCSID